MTEKYLWMSSIFRNVTGCKNFSKVSLRFKKTNSSRKILRTYSDICIFLCDAIDFKQPVEGTLKVLGKSLKTVLDEVHFIVNLYSFPLPRFPQEYHSFFKVSYLPHYQAEQLPKLPASRHINNNLSVYLFLEF